MTKESQNQVRILQFSEDFYPKTSGGAFIDWEFARRAADRGYEVSVYTPRMKGTPSREQVEGVEIRRPYKGSPTDRHPNTIVGQVRRILFAVLLTGHLLWTLDSEAVDIIYSTNHLMHPVTAFLSTVYGFPVVNFVGYSPTLYEDRKSWTDPLYVLEQVNFRFCMGEVVLSRTPEVKERLDSLSASNTRLIHGILNESEMEAARGVNREGVRSELGIQDDEHLVLYVGRFVPPKRPESAINVISELGKDYQLVMIGEGPIRDVVETEVERRGYRDRISLLGHQPHDETLRIIASADVLVVVSAVESYSTVAFEALVLGTPVVATPVGALPAVSHDLLYVVSRDEIPDRVSNVVVEERTQAPFDDQTLEQFGVDRFVDTALNAMTSVLAEESHPSLSSRVTEGD